jgi:excisionase family DNA binding protein
MKETSSFRMADSNPVVMLTQGELREMINDAIQAAMTFSGSSGRREHDMISDNALFSKPYLTVAEAAAFTTLAKSTIRLYGRMGKLKLRKIGKRCVISRDELNRLLTRN